MWMKWSSFGSVWKLFHWLSKYQLTDSIISSTKSELRSSGFVNGEYKNIRSVNCGYSQEILPAPTGAKRREKLKLTPVDHLLLVLSMEGCVSRPGIQLRLFNKQPSALTCNLLRPLLKWRIYTGETSNLCRRNFQFMQVKLPIYTGETSK
jgi:hypothetical protein